MDAAARRGGAIEAGAAGGLAGLAVFLVLHHVWIVAIWFIAPVGAAMAAAAGAAVGMAYVELLPRLPPRPWRALGLMALVAVILAPSIVVAELSGRSTPLARTAEAPYLSRSRKRSPRSSSDSSRPRR